MWCRWRTRWAATSAMWQHGQHLRRAVVLDNTRARRPVYAHTRGGRLRPGLKGFLAVWNFSSATLGPTAFGSGFRFVPDAGKPLRSSRRVVVFIGVRFPGVLGVRHADDPKGRADQLPGRVGVADRVGVDRLADLDREGPRVPRRVGSRRALGRRPSTSHRSRSMRRAGCSVAPG